MCIKGASGLKRFWIAAAAVVLALVLAISGIAVFSAGRSKPVLTCGDYTLDNTELAYYYWSEFFYFSEAYGEYLADTVDFSQPLSGQTYDGEQTWEDYLLEETLITVRDTMAMVFRAEEEGFPLPTDYDGTYQQVLVNFAAAAQEGGYRNLEAYLKASYGSGATQESFEDYLYNAHLAAAYSDHLLDQSLPTDDEARAYFETRQAEYVELYECDPEEESTWLEQARLDLQYETYQNAFLTICGQYEFLVNYDAVELTPPENLYA